MNLLFYISGLVAVVATALVITRSNAVHALLYFIVSLLAVALVFTSLGAPFAAALELIIYAGGVMVLFVFVIMLLNLSNDELRQESRWLAPSLWGGPAVLCAVLAGELFTVLATDPARLSGTEPVSPKQIGTALFGPYALATELASLLLLAGLVGAYHLGRQEHRR
jgi:NADH-quinone oxidoreductase subunit J